jgi:uncharacterized protein YegP (UPF0339 family)
MGADRNTVAQFRVYRTSEGEIVWRLVAPNNRVLATSAAGFSNADEVDLAVRRVRDGADAATLELVHVPDRDWIWRMLDGDGVLTAISSRSYKRRIDCVRAADRFRVAAPHALVDSIVGRRGRFWAHGGR